MTSQPSGPRLTGERASVVELLRRGLLDAELAALAWLLVESRVPLLVASPAPDGTDRVEVRDALADFLPATTRRVPLDAAGHALDRLRAADAAVTCLVGLDLTAAPAPALAVAFKALARGADLVASIDAGSLEEVFARLQRPDVGLNADELSFVGLVLMVRTPDAARSRVTAAHYVRPLARDPAGHIQRPGPAALAVWEPATDSFEHFAWGIASDLAGRVGLRPGDLDAEVARRAEYLVGLVDAGVLDPAAVRSALEGFRLAHGSAGPHRPV